ncbi:uncharacterized protein LOC143529460 [Bidens hawaiensis]|uniref:uncharacterized protein LOC143529460 n=1 Tax=Bidens hawaiensis TaxID=980011 RepID=UPI00404B0968
MEAFTSMVNKAQEEGILKGCQSPNRGPLATHLLYADDAMLIGEWFKTNMENVAKILRCFHMYSGLKINLKKSILFGSNVSGTEIGNLAGVIGCNAGIMPFLHLGLLVGANMNKIHNWNGIIDVFEKRLGLWRAHSLSIGGRVVLIKSVLESLPVYYFSLFKVPCKVVESWKV